MIIATWGRSNSGKTTLAANLAMAFADRDKIVGVISSNLQYGHVQILFGQTIHDKHGIYRAIDDNDANGHFWKSGLHENVFLLSVPNEYCRMDFENVTLRQAEELIMQAASHFDCVIIDGSDDIGNPVSSVGLTMSDKVLLLHRPSIASCSWYASKREIIPLLRLDEKILHIINAHDTSCNLGDYLGRANISVKLELPFIAEASTLENMGTLICSSDTRKSKEYNSVLNKIIEVITVE